jgi:hypothetical protein
MSKNKSSRALGAGRARDTNPSPSLFLYYARAGWARKGVGHIAV